MMKMGFSPRASTSQNSRTPAWKYAEGSRRVSFFTEESLMISTTKSTAPSTST